MSVRWLTGSTVSSASSGGRSGDVMTIRIRDDCVPGQEIGIGKLSIEPDIDIHFPEFSRPIKR